MRLSELLERNIIETTVGSILNKFKIKHRRNILFFGDILADYVKECEDAGYEEEMKVIAQKWCALITKQLVPELLKKLPTPLFFSFLKKMWVNLGLMDDLNVVKNKNIIRIKTRNEGSTGIIGKNYFTMGLFMGILNVLFKSEIECIYNQQTKKSCKYVFKIKEKPFSIQSKEMGLYYKLNSFQRFEGINFKNALQKNVFQLKRNNRIYFRRKIIHPIENTIFHLIGIQKILLERVPYISYRYFNHIVKRNATDEKKLYLLKNILGAMGWGIIKITIDKKKILFKIKYPPYGLQLERDNWSFFAKTVLGYIWLLDKNFKIIDVKVAKRELAITYQNRCDRLP